MFRTFNYIVQLHIFVPPVCCFGTDSAKICPLYLHYQSKSDKSGTQMGPGRKQGLLPILVAHSDSNTPKIIEVS